MRINVTEGDTMRRLAVINQKGGVGKTTTVVSLAGCFVQRGMRVLIIDCDGQCNASQWLRAEGRGIEAMLAGETPVPETRHGIDIIGGSKQMYFAQPETLPAPEGYDVVLYDSPATFGPVVNAIMRSAVDVIVPVEPKTMPLSGLADLSHSIQMAQHQNSSLDLLGVVVCRILRSKLTSDAIHAISQRFRVLGKIPENVRLAEAPGSGLPIHMYAPKSSGGLAYGALSQEVIK
tara:strand:+ start:7606 stop:8304 length:699 start_codon:yes stop_codon:yes gene_type:complete